MSQAVKTARVLQAAASNAAGGTTTGTALALHTALGGLATLVVTNGPTGPTLPCDAVLEISADGTNWHEVSRQTAGIVAGAAYAFHVDVPPAVLSVRSKFAGNTAQAVTVEASFQELTALASA